MLASMITSRSVMARSAIRRSAVVLGGQQERFYHENIVEHYENPRNVGSLDKNDDNVGTVRLVV
jgi:nitrogen fixation NifU-like protein